MGNLYERAELERLTLPGYKNEASVRAALGDDTDWDPVLSATIVSVDPSGKPYVLTGIRREETHRTHPGVISTPTMRLPKNIARDILASRFPQRNQRYPQFMVPRVLPARPTQVRAIADTLVEPVPNSHATLPFAMATLLSQKLGVAEAVEGADTETPLGTVSLASITAGFSRGATERVGGRTVDYYEPLIMLGALMILDDPDVIQREAPSYREMSWTEFPDFKQGVAEKRPDMIIAELQPEDALLCVHGMCLATSMTAVNVFDGTGQNASADLASIPA